jgi:hypothetical protein
VTKLNVSALKEYVWVLDSNTCKIYRLKLPIQIYDLDIEAWLQNKGFSLNDINWMITESCLFCTDM